MNEWKTRKFVLNSNFDSAIEFTYSLLFFLGRSFSAATFFRSRPLLFFLHFGFHLRQAFFLFLPEFISSIFIVCADGGSGETCTTRQKRQCFNVGNEKKKRKKRMKASKKRNRSKHKLIGNIFQIVRSSSFSFVRPFISNREHFEWQQKE